MLATIIIPIDLMLKLRCYWVIFWGTIVALLLFATPLPATQNPQDRSPQPCGNLQSTNTSLNCSLEGIDSIDSIVFSPDRQFIATGGVNGQSVKLWRVSDGRLLRTFDGLIGSAEFIGTPTASHLLVNDGSLYQLWHLDNSRLVWEIYEKNVGPVFPTDDRKSIITAMVKANKQVIFYSRQSHGYYSL